MDMRHMPSYGFAIDTNRCGQIQGGYVIEEYPDFRFFEGIMGPDRHRIIAEEIITQNNDVLKSNGIHWEKQMDIVDFIIFEMGAIKIGNLVSKEKCISYCHETRTPKMMQVVEAYRKSGFRIYVY